MKTQEPKVRCPKEQSSFRTLSEEIKRVIDIHPWINVVDVKEFIKNETDLINQFIIGQINEIALFRKRKELAGKELI